jgi:uroporphyrin-III C-methyltransferase
VLVDVGKRSGKHSAAQRFINRRLIHAARQYNTVVRLKGGDPMMFGRAQEEIDALHAAGIEVEVVPGITAALAAAAQSRISLTARGTSRHVSFVTPAVGNGEAASDWTEAACAADTAVLYMAARHASQHAQTLMQAGRVSTTPVLYVEAAGTAKRRQHCCTLADVALGALDSIQGDGPGLIMMGAAYQRALEQHKSITQHRDDNDANASEYRQVHG